MSVRFDEEWPASLRRRWVFIDERRSGAFSLSFSLSVCVGGNKEGDNCLEEANDLLYCLICICNCINKERKNALVERVLMTLIRSSRRNCFNLIRVFNSNYFETNSLILEHPRQWKSGKRKELSVCGIETWKTWSYQENGIRLVMSSLRHINMNWVHIIRKRMIVQ
jgi:hypothetical protein